MTDTYRIRSDDTWAKARDDYLVGYSAEEVCRRHDLGLSALRRRARVEGWRRTDQEDPTIADDELEIFEGMQAPDLIDMAWRRLAAALSRGQAEQAAKWLRIHEKLKTSAEAAVVADRHDADLTAQCAQRDPPKVYRPMPRLTPDGRNVHDVHPVFSSDDPDAPVSRQVRRRLEREAQKRS